MECKGDDVQKPVLVKVDDRTRKFFSQEVGLQDNRKRGEQKGEENGGRSRSREEGGGEI